MSAVLRSIRGASGAASTYHFNDGSYFAKELVMNFKLVVAGFLLECVESLVRSHCLKPNGWRGYQQY